MLKYIFVVLFVALVACAPVAQAADVQALPPCDRPHVVNSSDTGACTDQVSWYD